MTIELQESTRSTHDAARPSGRQTLLHKSSVQSMPACGDWDSELQDNNIAPLTRAEAEQMLGPAVSRPSRVTPFRVVAVQVALSLIVALVWWLFSKPPGEAALSALFGGAICWVPGALFAARLKMRGSTRSVLAWMLGQAHKIALSVAMFVAVAFLYRDVKWPALLVTYLIVLKTYWIALAWR